MSPIELILVAFIRLCSYNNNNNNNNNNNKVFVSAFKSLNALTAGS